MLDNDDGWWSAAREVVPSSFQYIVRAHSMLSLFLFLSLAFIHSPFLLVDAALLQTKCRGMKQRQNEMTDFRNAWADPGMNWESPTRQPSNDHGDNGGFQRLRCERVRRRAMRSDETQLDGCGWVRWRQWGSIRVAVSRVAPSSVVNLLVGARRRQRPGLTS